jgi:ABC-type nitrate/sulfonate/bicarbonate transport system permease component
MDDQSEDRRKSNLLDRTVGIGVIVFILAAIELSVRAGKVNAAIIPPPTAIGTRLVEILSNGSFFGPLASTLYLLAVAYSASCALAIVAGLMMGRFTSFHNLFEPLVELLRPLPKPALLPPLILFLGLGDAMKITTVGLAVFFPVLINTIQGVKGVDPVLINTARTFGYNSFDTLRKIILPATLPLIMAGMRVSLSLGLILVITAEMLAGTGGLGFIILDMQRSFRVHHMYAWLIILAVVGYFLNYCFVLIERRVIHWSLPDSN